jgi:hypothetical protein
MTYRRPSKGSGDTLAGPLRQSKAMRFRGISITVGKSGSKATIKEGGAGRFYEDTRSPRRLQRETRAEFVGVAPTLFPAKRSSIVLRPPKSRKNAVD